ncbi:neuropeptide FF receptor 1-like [Solea senegalensis]|uniref:Neuropeptide FF receptor 1 n=1 Tax=Solea senegalensis TaxID=28829 RepID=A0AAV6QK56_SOLSE|nr:neuropeptide FF receptor 1 like 2 isoform X1 [Solea senegalensis]KAG7490576.1 neuropeptide FF receptor 1-like [Solea senegalensis]
MENFGCLLIKPGKCCLIRTMEIRDKMAEEGLELEGSAAAEPLMNVSLDSFTNVTNITLSPYYQHSLYVAASYILAYFFIFLLCMIGNILVCLIVLENHRMRTVTNLFILNLAISDLLVGIFCIPTTLVDNLITGWPFSNIVCKMSGFVQGVSVSASVFTLVAIAVERFRCIMYPLQPKPTVLVAKAAIVLIWVLAVAIMCPAAVALTVEKYPYHYMVYGGDFNHTLPVYTCYEDFENPQMRKIYTAVLFAHIYLLPLTIITVMYGCIGVKLCSTVVANRNPPLDNTVQVGGRRGGQPMISQKKIRAIKMLTLVALLFMLSWLPLWTLMIMADYAGLDRDLLDLLTSYIFPFAHWLAFSNSSINPIIYGYYNENFRRGFQAVYKSRHSCCLTQVQLWGRMSRRGRQEGTVLAPCGGTALREATNHHNHLVLGLTNRVHNDDKLKETDNMNRRARVGCAMVQPERNLSNQGIEMAPLPKKESHSHDPERLSSLAVSVYQAWDN